MDDQRRYSRQQRLPEVGDLGQARLARASLHVAAGPAAGTELAYLERAGVGAVFLSSLGQQTPFVHAGYFRHAASRTLAAGAWRALHKINASLASP